MQLIMQPAEIRITRRENRLLSAEFAAGRFDRLRYNDTRQFAAAGLAVSAAKALLAANKGATSCWQLKRYVLNTKII
jgi:hypothetical protein